MENLPPQTDSTKLTKKDFDKVLDSESVIFQDTEERKLKLFDMPTKMLELKKPKTFRKRAALELEIVEADKKRKLNQIKIPQVPDEIWLKILNFMDSKTIFANFALVCKNFHRLTLDSGAVKSIELDDIKSSEHYKNAMKVLKRSKNIDRVKIEYSSTTYCNNFITQAFKSNPKLKSLIVSKNWFQLTNSTKKVFGKNLETLALGAILLDDNEEIVNAILSQRNLKTLHLSHILESNILTKLLNLLPKKCKKLSDVHFGSILHGDVTRIASTFDNFFEEVKENLKSFKCHVTNDPTWEQILKNLSLCKKLEVLEIFDALFISNTTLTIISMLPNLKSLTLTRLGSNATELSTLFQKMNLEKLEYLQIESNPLSNEELQTFLNRKPPNLRHLWFPNCPNLDLEESTMKNLKNCPKLKNVGFDGFQFDGISTDLLGEINDNIKIFMYYTVNWIEFDKKLKLEQCKENFIKVIQG